MGNPIIERLAEQASLSANAHIEQHDPALWYSDRGPPQSLIYEKFVELLLDECYKWSKHNGGLGSENDLQDLKRHLGLEP